MKLATSDFVFLILKEARTCRYLYKCYVYSLISVMRHNRGIQCDASDDEIYAVFKSAWNACI